MNEWRWPFFSRALLHTLSAVLTLCLLVQFFIAGMAAMTDPGWWTYHSAWVAIFQWLVVPLPILAWLSGASRGRRTLFATIPLLQVALQYVLAHRANRRPTYDWSGPTRLGCRTSVVDRCRVGSWFVRLTKLIV
jgi:Family of unknown function (DUF6220)